MKYTKTKHEPVEPMSCRFPMQIYPCRRVFEYNDVEARKKGQEKII